MNSLFCHNCGSSLNLDSAVFFCWNCGVKIELEVNSDDIKPLESKDLFENEQNKASYGSNTNCIILTNIYLLSKKLKVSEYATRQLISSYIESVQKLGHTYILLDAGKHFFSFDRPLKSWQEHNGLLNNIYRANNSNIEYLFIIGGDDVVPMPKISNQPLIYYRDVDIETDMPYSYLISDDFENLLWNGDIFNHPIKLYTGRLPISEDCSVEKISRYFDNSLYVLKNGLGNKSLFGFSAKSWEDASKETIKKVSFDKQLLTSPEHNLLSVDVVFNPQSDYYYFNLHGSDSPGSPEFFGDDESVISPNHIVSSETHNIILTEACYGAKFIDYEIESSMLLSAIFSKSVVYVGSSRVAFGSNTEDITSADIIAKSFWNNIISGQSSGKSLADARKDAFLESPNHLFDYGLTTAVEFNLFGDPLCSKNPFTNGKMTKTTDITASKTLKHNKDKLQKNEISLYDTKSLLNEVRTLVNQTIENIRNTLISELYNKYKIEPGELSSVFEYKGEREEYYINYNFNKKSTLGSDKICAVFTDKEGKIKSILLSK